MEGEIAGIVESVGAEREYPSVIAIAGVQYNLLFFQKEKNAVQYNLLIMIQDRFEHV